ncbi:MAG: MATE family efflux transporter, partial [Candidatus Spyradocola sp.]
IVLDLFFVLVLRMGSAGAGVATVLSQVISAVLVIVTLLRSETAIRLFPRRIAITGWLLRDIVKIGLPAGFQSVLYSLSNIVVQSAVNAFGTTVIAAYTAYGKMDGLFWMIIGAFGVSITTFVGQNFGAQKFDRMHRSVRVCLGMAFAATILLEVIFVAGGEFILGLFSRDPAVIAEGVDITRHIAPTFVLYVCIEILSGALRGTGESLVPMIMTCVGVCLLRVVWILAVAPHFNTVAWTLYSYPVSWGLTSLLFIGYYLQGSWLKRRKKAMGFAVE